MDTMGSLLRPGKSQGVCLGRGIARCASPCWKPMSSVRSRQRWRGTSAAATVEQTYGRCDVLVNCAGYTRMVPHHDLEALDDELIDAIFAANVRGPFATVRAFAPLMKQSGDAVIVNVSSVAAITGSGSNIAYGGSKAALDTMALSLARVLGPEIRVLTVSPAAVDTAFVPGRTTAMVERVAATTPLKRVVRADEVAQAIMAAITHLTSSTGIVIPVDGGKLVG